MIEPKVLLIECFALGYTVENAARVASVSLDEARLCLAEQAEAIKAREQQLQTEHAIFSPVERMKMLGRVAHLGLDGYLGTGKGGAAVKVRNPALTVQAVREANAMQQGVRDEPITATEIEKRKVISDLMAELRRDYPDKSDQELQEFVRSLLPEYSELLH
jgi:hypothetical protein